MRREPSPTYQLFMLVLCIFALASLAVQVAVHLDPEIERILDYADFAVCMVFLFDFLFSLWRAENRWRYLTTWGWLDLLSSIPTVDAARWGRVARVVRVFRVLRGFRATKVLTEVLLRRRTQHAFLAATLIAILLIVFCSIAILQFETRSDSNIRTAEDALWWAVTTITTVGYGDRVPVTGEGRLIAVLLMTAGVGLFGAFSGLLAAWFLRPRHAGEENEIAKLRGDIAELRKIVEGRGLRE